MQQIVIIHGGDSFLSDEEYLNNLKDTKIDYERLKPTKKWRDRIVAEFPNSDILTPTMPNSANAQFEEWKIWFEKIIPFFQDDVRLIGHSLGAMFLAKYFHLCPLKHPVKQLHLIAGSYDDNSSGCGSFVVNSAEGLEKSAHEIYLYHSEDDPVVPFSELTRYQADLPHAVSFTFLDRGHFLDEDFPELISILKQK